MSCLSSRAPDCRLAPGTGHTQGSDHPQPSVLNPPNAQFLPSDALQGSPHTEGQWDILQPPGRAGSITRSTVPLRLSSPLHIKIINTAGLRVP